MQILSILSFKIIIITGSCYCNNFAAEDPAMRNNHTAEQQNKQRNK